MHPPADAAAWLVWLESTGPAVAMRQWLWLYPIVEIVHILGFILLVGAAFMFDVRLLGLSRSLPVARMARHLLRWARLSLLLVIPSGVMMFMAHAVEFSTNPAFQLKLSFIGAAFLNAAVFHRWPFRTVGTWDTDVASPGSARLAGALSLVLWTGVVACGRLLAYF